MTTAVSARLSMLALVTPEISIFDRFFKVVIDLIQNDFTQEGSHRRFLESLYHLCRSIYRRKCHFVELPPDNVTSRAKFDDVKKREKFLIHYLEDMFEQKVKPFLEKMIRCKRKNRSSSAALARKCESLLAQVHLMHYQDVKSLKMLVGKNCKPIEKARPVKKAYLRLFYGSIPFIPEVLWEEIFSFFTFSVCVTVKPADIQLACAYLVKEVKARYTFSTRFKRYCESLTERMEFFFEILDTSIMPGQFLSANKGRVGISFDPERALVECVDVFHTEIQGREPSVFLNYKWSLATRILEAAARYMNLHPCLKDSPCSKHLLQYPGVVGQQIFPIVVFETDMEKALYAFITDIWGSRDYNLIANVVPGGDYNLIANVVPAATAAAATIHRVNFIKQLVSMKKRFEDHALCRVFHKIHFTLEPSAETARSVFYRYQIPEAKTPSFPTFTSWVLLHEEEKVNAAVFAAIMTIDSRCFVPLEGSCTAAHRKRGGSSSHGGGGSSHISKKKKE